MGDWFAWAHSSGMKGWDNDLSGYVASALVLLTFSMKSMRWLRVIAICSNLAFIYYAARTDMRPILVLHSILLPVNICRLAQLMKPDRFPLARPTARSGPTQAAAEVPAPATPPLAPARVPSGLL